ncbi:hypothetical protein SAMN06265222_10827 [Neorhodopirellula lusitana]|uniref:Uncharacterized protein n=1 Tax=Neorhodopirellula lusitana TaxID=445327 RepID=A0ABY1QCK7_9BACT|nr:hypothetical protein SAMN06265222_10827 [Neorhodopirellula lusitana]
MYGMQGTDVGNVGDSRPPFQGGVGFGEFFVGAWLYGFFRGFVGLSDARGALRGLHESGFLYLALDLTKSTV